MPGWTANSLLPATLLNKVNGPMTPEQKLRLSGGVTRQALTNAIVPAATNPGTVAASNNKTIVPAATSGGNSATSVVPATTNTPSFLQGGNQSTNPTADIIDLLTELLGGQKQDPELVKAQTILAQQQAMQVARSNEQARNQEAQQAAMGYLQSQMKDAAKYQTGGVGNILMQRYADRAKTLQQDGQLNWLNMPSSSYSVPKKSGWTGPAMPGTWGL
jgi:hypothetical protein